MADLFNPDFQDFLRALHALQVRYLLVGGYSVILHGYPRTTGDLDIWVEKSPENYARLVQAFARFGMPIFDMTAPNFLHNDRIDVFTFGRQPVAVDIITNLKGLDFAVAYAQSLLLQVDGLLVRLINRTDLITAKRASGRNRDLNDLEHLLDEE